MGSFAHRTPRDLPFLHSCHVGAPSTFLGTSTPFISKAWPDPAADWRELARRPTLNFLPTR